MAAERLSLGKRVYDNDITNTNASSAHIMDYIGLSGIRIANNIFWATPDGRPRHVAGPHRKWQQNDTEALAEFRNDPTWLINNTCWGDDSFENAGYGNPFVAVMPATITFDPRNNIVDNASPATGREDAGSTPARPTSSPPCPSLE